MLKQNSTEKAPSLADPRLRTCLVDASKQSDFDDPGKFVAALSDLTSIPDLAVMHLQYASVIFL